jgi:hypothetical protein
MNRILHDSIKSAPMTNHGSSQHALNDQKMNVIWERSHQVEPNSGRIAL